MTGVPERLVGALADRYLIERELGQGGMATVYLAEDLKHHRKVALKVLRPEIAVTVGAGRFAREIEVAARLQHPNILPLLDSGSTGAQGHGGTEFLYYVMPYVEGESLRDRLARGGELPIQDAVRILMEVADALSHAHAHGVVHRDIKPDNVLLSGRHALVADFGVAKAVTEATGRQLLTSTGVALGTPTYMAPEQATADPHQDHRVDIYALGVLGYELLTGRAPFAATTAQEMLAAHVTAAPDPVERYRATVSPALAAVVMKCLAKKPADRWQTAEEVLQHLEPLATPSGGTTPTQTAPVEAVRARRRSLAIAAGGGVLALAAVAILVWPILRPQPLSITLEDIRPVTSEPGVEFQPAISPDGSEIAYVAGPIARPRLFVRSTANVSGGAALRLADTALGSEWLPSWTSDGQFVRFRACTGPMSVWSPACVWRETGKLGGVSRSAALPTRSLANNRNLAWSPDGTRVAFVLGDTVFLASVSDTVPRNVAVERTQSLGLHSLAWSPDGRSIAYVNGVTEWSIVANWSPSSIWIVSTDGGAPREVVGDDALNVSPEWLDDRHLLFVSNRDGPRGLYVVDVGSRGRRRAPRPVPGVADPHTISYSAGAHEVAFARFAQRQNIWSYPLTASSPVSIRDGTPVTDGNQVIQVSDVSPDGRWLLFDSNLRGIGDLYRMPIGGGEPVQLTNLPGPESFPRWSPDGTEIAFEGKSVGPPALHAIMVMRVDGGQPSVVTTSQGLNVWPSWSPSGRDVVFESTRTGALRVWIVSRDSVGGPWHQPRQLVDIPCVSGSWAQDGSGVLCSGRGATEGDVMLISPRGQILWRRSLAGWRFGYPSSSRDGKTIYASATSPDGRLGVWALPAAGGEPHLVVLFDDPSLTAPWGFSIGPDRLYLTVGQTESDIWVARLKY